MPRVRLTDTPRVHNGIGVPDADPSIRLRGEFVEVTEKELESLEKAIEDGKFPALTLDNVEMEQSEGEMDATEAAIDLALEHDLEIGDIEGTGKEGRVLKSDVQDALD